MRVLRIVSRCSTEQQFVTIFGALCDGKSIFIATNQLEPVGTAFDFTLTLSTGAVALAASGVVAESYRSTLNAYGLSGIKLDFGELDQRAKDVVEKLAKQPKLPSLARKMEEANPTGKTEIAANPLEVKLNAACKIHEGAVAAGSAESGNTPNWYPGKSAARAASEISAKSGKFAASVEETETDDSAKTDDEEDEDSTDVVEVPEMWGPEPSVVLNLSNIKPEDEQPNEELERKRRHSSVIAPRTATEIPDFSDDPKASPPRLPTSPGTIPAIPGPRAKSPSGITGIPEIPKISAASSVDELPDDFGDVELEPDPDPGDGEVDPEEDTAVADIPAPATTKMLPEDLPKPPAVPAAATSASSGPIRMADIDSAPIPVAPYAGQRDELDPTTPTPIPDPAVVVGLGPHDYSDAFSTVEMNALTSNPARLAVVTGLAATAFGIGIGYLIWGGAGQQQEVAAAPVETADAIKSADETTTAADTSPTEQSAAKLDDPEPDDPDAPDVPDDDGEIPAIAPVDPALNANCPASITSAPSVVEIFIGKTLLGVTPYEGKIPCGAVRLTFKRVRYSSKTRSVKASTDATTTFKISLARPTTSLFVTSRPRGAAIKINGRSVGRTDRTVTVPAYESIKVTVTRADSPPQTKKVKAKPGKKTTVRFKFVKPKKKKKSTSKKKKKSTSKKKSSKRR